MKRVFSPQIIFSLSITALIVFIVACNKNIDASGNKAYLSVTHISPDAPPLDIFFEGTQLNTSGQLPFDSTTGVLGDPYLIAIAGIHNLQLKSGSEIFVTGNIAMQRTHHYSVFAYDSVNNATTTDSSKLKTLIVEDQLAAPVDTISLIRFLNFCDTSFYISMLNIEDTITTLPYARKIQSNTDPTSLTYNKIRSGTYQIIAANDTTVTYNLDSLSLIGGKIYTVYITGSAKSTDPNALKRGLIQHN